MSFVQTFGGATINPTFVSYAPYTISANLVLQWPFQADDNANILASKIGVTASVGSLVVAFPDASIVSVGQDALVYNTGSNTFTVTDFSGNTLASVASGQAWYFYLTNNSTQHGTWQVFQFGVGISAAQASSLAGAGLQAVNTLLNQNLPILPLNGNFTINIAQLATVIQNNGGSVVWTFADAGAGAGQLPLGWFVYAINSGSGNVTLTAGAGDTIDAAATKVLAPTESCVIFSDGLNLWTLGFGQSIVSTVTGASINVSASGAISLTANQVAAQVQDFTGTLTSNTTVDYGTGVGYWLVWNNTSGVYTLTSRVNSGDAGAAITQGNYSIIRSDGTNMKVAFTATTGTVTSIATAAGQLTGGPITSTGTIGLATTAVTPGAYGNGTTQTLTATVDAYGRLTALAATSIALTISQISTFTSAAFYGQLSDGQGTGRVVFATSPTITTPTLTNPVVGTQLSSDNSTLAASTAYVTSAVATGITGLATLASPSFTGVPTAPTAAAANNSTQLATTAYADRVAGLTPAAWTPVDASGAGLTFTNVSANYTKIGNMIYAYFELTFPATGSGVAAVIGGLPVAAASHGYANTAAILQAQPGGITAPYGVVIKNTATFGLWNSNGTVVFTNAALTTQTISGVIIYPVA